MNETVTPNRRLDLLGFFCPIPVHETRKALGEMQEGDFLEVRADDPETLQDMPALCNSCLLYTSPSPRDYAASRMPSSA